MRRILGLLIAASLAAGCSRCGRGGPDPVDPAGFLPPAPGPAIVIPSLGEAARQIAGLHRALATGPGGEALQGPLEAVRAQLGFDPLSAKGLTEAGLDPARGAAASIPPDGAPLLVLPVSDPARL